MLGRRKSRSRPPPILARHLAGATHHGVGHGESYFYTREVGDAQETLHSRDGIAGDCVALGLDGQEHRCDRAPR